MPTLRQHEQRQAENDGGEQRDRCRRSRRCRPALKRREPVAQRRAKAERALEGRDGRRRSGSSRDRCSRGDRRRCARRPRGAACEGARARSRARRRLEPRASSSIACGSDCAWGNPSRRSRCRRAATSSTRLTLSKNSAQSTSDIRRMLVMTLRTVTFDRALALMLARARSRRRSCPARASRSSSQRSAGVDRGILVAQPLHQLHGEGRRQTAPARRRASDVGDRLGSRSPTPSSRSASASASWRARAAAHDALGRRAADSRPARCAA